MTIPLRDSLLLTWDTETRPLVFTGSDLYQSAEITALGWVFSDAPKDVTVYLLGRDDPLVMLRAFSAAYDRAEVVTGHYVRKFDLGIMQSALMEYGLPLLGPKMVLDTKLDMKKKHDLSASQENLAEMLMIGTPKFQMNQTKWRAANRLTPGGIELAEKRVVSDVHQHVKLRQAMLRAGLLNGPRVWRP